MPTGGSAIVKNKAIYSPTWSTASFGEAADTSPMDLATLGDHLSQCREIHSRRFRMRCYLQTAGQFLTSRVVTTLFMVCLLLAMLLSAL
jgi:hypothetical protein